MDFNSKYYSVLLKEGILEVPPDVLKEIIGRIRTVIEKSNKFQETGKYTIFFKITKKDLYSWKYWKDLQKKANKPIGSSIFNPSKLDEVLETMGSLKILLNVDDPLGKDDRRGWYDNTKNHMGINIGDIYRPNNWEETVEHELLHWVQKLFRDAFGITNAGLPRKGILNPDIFQHSSTKLKSGEEIDSWDAHSLDDVEFFTKLKDTISRITKKLINLWTSETTNKNALIKNAIDSDAFLSSLYRHNKAKYKRAVSEVISQVPKQLDAEAPFIGKYKSKEGQVMIKTNNGKDFFFEAYPKSGRNVDIDPEYINKKLPNWALKVLGLKFKTRNKLTKTYMDDVAQKVFEKFKDQLTRK